MDSTHSQRRTRRVAQIDYATGFLGAYGVILALTDRQIAAKEVQRHPPTPNPNPEPEPGPNVVIEPHHPWPLSVI